MRNLILYGPQPPLFSYGGPVRSLDSLLKILSPSFNVTAISPSFGLDGSKANPDTNNEIIYSSRPFISLLKKCFEFKTPYVWYNSFFQFNFLFLLFLSKLRICKLIISPRGQLAEGAIQSSKPLLKKLFIKFSRILISKSVHFHATSNEELNLIKKLFGTNSVKMIPNISNLPYVKNNNCKGNFVFFSRISKKKGLLELLKSIDENNLSINLDIYGYKEDLDYWGECKKIIDNQNNISYCGTLKNGDLTPLKGKYTYFIFPTYNENYGHVIFEALSLGLLPLLSKGTTPFDKAINDIVGLNFNRNSNSDIIKSITSAQSLKKDEIIHLRKLLKDYFNELKLEQNKFEKQYITFVNKLINS